MNEPLIGDHISSSHPDMTAGFRGLVNRDPVAQKQGYSAVIPPAQIKVYPRSDWPKMIADKVASKSQLSDIMKRVDGWVNLDQNGQGYCATADTEVLTDKGWVMWPEYNGSDLLGTMNVDTGNMEFQAPLQNHVYAYKGEMVYSMNRRIDFGVTPDHRMLVRKWDEGKRTLSSNYTFQKAGELGWYCGLPHSTKGWVGTELKRVGVPGDREYSGDDFVQLLSLIVSDGYAGGSDKTRNWVSFCCFREDQHEAISCLAARNGFHESPQKRGVWVRYDAEHLAHWVRTHCYTSPDLKAPNKKVPEIVKQLSMRQIRLFINRFGDQNHKEGSETVFYSTSKRLMDDLQEMHLRLGKRGTITKRDPRVSVLKSGKEIHGGVSYTLVISSTDRLCLDRKQHLTTDAYDGLVYCATVPNSTLITRRNGSVLVSGNCWAYGSVGALIAARAKAKQPYVRLSAHAVGCKVKGFRDEGGWGALSLEYIQANGVPDVAHWAEKSMSRSYDTADTWANAKLYMPDESFVDLASAVYDRNMAFEQQATCLLDNNPTVDDYDHWGHCVWGADLVDGATQRGVTRAESGKLMGLAEFDLAWGMNHPVTGGIGKRIGNSWQGWGDRGFGILTGDKAIGNNSVAICSAIA